MFNNFTCMARVCKDPEIRQAGNTPCCTVRLATSTNQRVDGEWVAHTLFFDAVVFGERFADRMSEFRKGDMMLVSGQLNNRSYTTRGGETRESLTLDVQKFEYVDLNKNNAGNIEPNEAAATGDLPF